MHEYFSTWLEDVYVELSPDIESSRWRAVAALARWADQPEKALLLGEMSVAAGRVSNDDLGEFWRLIGEVDSSISMDENRAEVQVLAASAVIQLFEDHSEFADVAALCVATGTFGGRAPETAPGLQIAAENFLDWRAVATRTFEKPDRDQSFSSGQKGSITKQLNRVEAQITEDPQATASAIRELCKVVGELAGRLSRVAKAELDTRLQFERQQAIIAEESDILWWITNRASTDLTLLQDRRDTARFILETAWEFSNLVTQRVPPLASLEYLRHSLSVASAHNLESICIVEALSASNPEWLIFPSNSLPSRVGIHAMPILGGLNLKRQSVDDAWESLYVEQTGLSSGTTVASDELAVQVVRESALCNALSGIKPD